jgi:hypothetical protein
MNNGFEIPQPVEKSNAKADVEAAGRMFADAYAVPEKTDQNYVEKESVKIAEMLAAYPGASVEDAVRRISADLLQLADNPEQYNALLKKTHDRAASGAASLNIDESSFNQSTGTWDNVTINARMHPGYRLVQPGLTLEEMTVDYIKQTTGNKIANPSTGLVKAVMNDIIKENSEYQKIADIKNPDDIKVGQFLSVVSFPLEYDAYDQNGNLKNR